ncbi:heavy-metal-associated domain-containing protein [Salinicola tamaricis]|uniref:heavy-metal-associated domain-containing protein n=1 Tax=Salinicola tamaricis TaxID=1771309 RepID=UPI0030F3EAF1
MNHYRYRVDAMHCQGCVKRIRAAVAVADAEATLEAAPAQRELAVTTELDEASLRRLLDHAGYPATPLDEANAETPPAPAPAQQAAATTDAQSTDAQSTDRQTAQAGAQDSASARADNPALRRLAIGGMTCAPAASMRCRRRSRPPRG